MRDKKLYLSAFFIDIILIYFNSILPIKQFINEIGGDLLKTKKITDFNIIKN